MKVTIIGAGNTGLAMAAHLSKDGHQVTLWNRSREPIETLMKSRTIHSEGIIEGSFVIDKVTDDMAEALENTDIIMITTPAFSHKSLARLIGKHLKNEPIIILNPGRTCGAIEFQTIFSRYNRKCQPTIAETQTAIYTSRKTYDDSVMIYSIKKNVLLSTFDSNQNQSIIDQLPETFKPHLMPAQSLVETSIGNVGMILHTAPLLLNTGWTENPNHEYLYYHDGITPTISNFIEKLDNERINVGKRLGSKIESTKEWMKRVYNIKGRTLYECIQNNEAYQKITAPNTLHHRYIYEDIACGLVPLEFIGKSVGLKMAYTGLVIDLASAILDENFRRTGRNLQYFQNRVNIKKFFQVGEFHEARTS